MKTILFFIVAGCGLFGFAQQRPDTIYCNAFQNVILTTPSAIVQAATGSENFVFSYNQAKPDSLGLLQGRPGHTGNLVLRTRDGGLFTFLLKHRDSLKRHAYFLKPGDRINPPLKRKGEPKKRTNLDSLKKSPKYYHKLARFYVTSKAKRKAVGRNQGLILELVDIKYYREETFVVYRLKNRSDVSFRLAHMELSQVVGKPGRKSSYQQLPLRPVFEYNLPDAVGPKEERSFVVVYPRFTLSKATRLEAVITERQGRRQVALQYN